MNRNKGFTLIEVLVTTAVLAFGIVSVFQALFMIMGAFGYISHYLAVIPSVDEKVWQAQDAVMRLGPKAGLAPQGVFDIGAKQYDWALSARLADPAAGLYRIDLVTQWRDGRKSHQLVRSAQVIYESDDETE
ncbi:MAG: prepilin-type N-terminal cleavage/methylation domain-containing protein [Candidatus Omnitrophica bacterium]|nr:prepilin-type N-terminal cleavage/methylation domain-containing protein [Candidatus Omnitrophota bacterium]MDD5775559.1 prepilin-type N-terminal cleavage/methylation domain-containing protein [Candidatus Omnitrophota bacterium]